MGMNAPTPDVELPPDAADTPDTEPVDQPEADAVLADQSPADARSALGQAEYTRSQQAFSGLKDRLGLPRNASREDVLAAVDALQSGGDGEDEDLVPDDPRIAEYAARAFRAEVDAVGAIYGDDFTSEGLELINGLREIDDPRELFSALHAFVARYGGAADDADEGDEGDIQDPNAVPPVPGTSEGDRAPARQPISAARARQESGAVQAVRGLFEKAGIASRERQT